jgi:hypothetical protein
MSKALRGEVWDVEFKPAVGAEIQNQVQFRGKTTSFGRKLGLFV